MNKLTPSQVLIATRMKQEGHTYQRIGMLFGVTRQRIHQLVKGDSSIRAPHGARCDECGVTHLKIHLHHTDYETGATIPLCPSCHRKHHVREWWNREAKELRGETNTPIAFRRRRLKANLPQAEVGRRMGISQQSVSDLERGKRDWSEDLIQQYRKAITR